MTRRSDLREPVLILGTWCFFCAWVVGYCSLSYVRGPQTEADGAELSLVWGLPDWVFWGIALPWMVATLFTIFFASKLMQEEPFDA